MRTNRLVHQTTDLDKRRTAYTAWIWQTVTHGDHTAAPMILTAQSTRRHTGGQAVLVLALQQRSSARVHRLIADHAYAIAQHIDEN